MTASAVGGGATGEGGGERRGRGEDTAAAAVSSKAAAAVGSTVGGSGATSAVGMRGRGPSVGAMAMATGRNACIRRESQHTKEGYEVMTTTTAVRLVPRSANSSKGTQNNIRTKTVTFTTQDWWYYYDETNDVTTRQEERKEQKRSGASWRRKQEKEIRKRKLRIKALEEEREKLRTEQADLERELKTLQQQQLNAARLVLWGETYPTNPKEYAEIASMPGGNLLMQPYEYIMLKQAAETAGDDDLATRIAGFEQIEYSRAFVLWRMQQHQKHRWETVTGKQKPTPDPVRAMKSDLFRWACMRNGVKIFQATQQTWKIWDTALSCPDAEEFTTNAPHLIKVMMDSRPRDAKPITTYQYIHTMAQNYIKVPVEDGEELVQVHLPQKPPNLWKIQPHLDLETGLHATGCHPLDARPKDGKSSQMAESDTKSDPGYATTRIRSPTQKEDRDCGVQETGGRN